MNMSEEYEIKSRLENLLRVTLFVLCLVFASIEREWSHLFFLTSIKTKWKICPKETKRNGNK